MKEKHCKGLDNYLRLHHCKTSYWPVSFVNTDSMYTAWVFSIPINISEALKKPAPFSHGCHELFYDLMNQYIVRTRSCERNLCTDQLLAPTSDISLVLEAEAVIERKR